MNYERIYFSIINNRRYSPVEGYTERHHILPRSIGGADTPDNLVGLSAREHFVCHLLLTKMYKGTEHYRSMLGAFMMMLRCKSGYQHRHVTSRRFSKLREEFSKMCSQRVSGSNNPSFGTKWITNLSTLESKKFKGESIPEGWVKGRGPNSVSRPPDAIPGKYIRLSKLELTRRKTDKRTSIGEKIIPTLREWNFLYKEVGFKRFVEVTGYDKSQSNLVRSISRWIPND